MARKLTLISTDPTPVDLATPPPELGAYGVALWKSVTIEFDLADIGGRETLRQLCLAADRAESCREVIAKQGLMVRSKAGGVRPHPLLQIEMTARNFVVKALGKLGLTLEPVRAIGRPPIY
jgi:P27 family predicted phage terminase small subunit